MMNTSIKPLLSIIGICFLCLMPITAQDTLVEFSHYVDWENTRLHATVSMDLYAANLRLPAGRSQAEELSMLEFPALLLPALYEIQNDSSSTIRDVSTKGVLSLAVISAFSESAQRVASRLSPDLRYLHTDYVLDLKKLSAELIRHKYPAQPPRTLLPISTADYTGIIIYANEKLPLHGTRRQEIASACLFPKVWDSDMNLLYERNMVEPETAREHGIVRYTYISDERAHIDKIGPRPLRILAQGLFGVHATDPIINREDALKLLSSSNNRALLAAGKVVIVLAPPSDEKR
jgi:hypothetical protein